MKPVRAGVVGVGYLGKFHAEKYAGLSGVHLVGVYDADRDTSRAIGDALNVRACESLEELLETVDAVSVVVPTEHHFAVAKKCLECGVDVLVEKPITVTAEEADELISCANDGGRILQVGHLERFNAAVLALDDILVKPMFIESHRLAPFKDRGTDVDVILDIMIHDIDIILTIVGAPVTAVHAVGVPVLSKDKNDIANVRLEFETGCIANITASRISLKEMRKLRIFQTNTYMSVDYAAQHVDVYRKIPSSETTDMPQITYDQIEITQHDALNEEIRSFVDAVANRTRPRVPGEAGRNALRVALEIVDQIHSRQAALHV